MVVYKCRFSLLQNNLEEVLGFVAVFLAGGGHSSFFWLIAAPWAKNSAPQAQSTKASDWGAEGARRTQGRAKGAAASLFLGLFLFILSK